MHWYVAVGAEAVALALLIVVVGQQLAPVLRAAAPGGGTVAWAHYLLAESQRLLARVGDAELRPWLPSALAALLTVTGPWLRRSTVRWGLGVLAGSRVVSVIGWLIVAVVAGLWGQS